MSLDFILNAPSKRELDDGSIQPSKKPRLDRNTTADHAEQTSEEAKEVTSAAQKALIITELLENILLHLPGPAEVMAAQTVNRQFRNVVVNSPGLQKKAFRKKAGMTKSLESHAGDDRTSSIPPNVHPIATPRDGARREINRSLLEPQDGRIYNLTRHARKALFAAIDSHAQSCDKIQFSSAPCKHLFFDMKVVLGSSTFTFSRTVRKRDGVTFGDLAEAVWGETAARNSTGYVIKRQGRREK